MHKRKGSLRSGDHYQKAIMGEHESEDSGISHIKIFSTGRHADYPAVESEELDDPDRNRLPVTIILLAVISAVGLLMILGGNLLGSGSAEPVTPGTVHASSPAPPAKTPASAETVTETVRIPAPAETRTIRVPGPTVTHTVPSPVPGPTVKVPVPGPTVTHTVTSPPKTKRVTAPAETVTETETERICLNAVLIVIKCPA